MDYKKVVEKNLDYFTKILEEFQDEHHAVAQSKVSHLKRFEKILELGDFNNKHILDVGCGIGGFYEFLKEKNINCDYTGIDINQKMIDTAKERNPEIKDKFFVFDIIEKEMNGTFDYIISVGPLNLKSSPSLNVDFTMRLLKEMYRMAVFGSALSMTSELTKKPSIGTFYYDPAIILSETAKFCSNLKIDHTYLPHDFTVFCYKKSLYTPTKNYV